MKRIRLKWTLQRRSEIERLEHRVWKAERERSRAERELQRAYFRGQDLELKVGETIRDLRLARMHLELKHDPLRVAIQIEFPEHFIVEMFRREGSFRGGLSAVLDMELQRQGFPESLYAVSERRC